MKPWIAYVRNGHDEPLALDSQAADIRAHLASLGLGPVEILSDLGPARGKRPGLTTLVRRAKAGEVAGVCALSADRLSRRVVDFLELSADLDANGVRLLLVREALDTATPQGELFLAMTRLVAEREREFAALR